MHPAFMSPTPTSTEEKDHAIVAAAPTKVWAVVLGVAAVALLFALIVKRVGGLLDHLP
jgi:hypothetical protein